MEIDNTQPSIQCLVARLAYIYNSQTLQPLSHCYLTPEQWSTHLKIKDTELFSLRHCGSHREWDVHNACVFLVGLEYKS